MVDEFTQYLKSQLGNPYLWGGTGEYLKDIVKSDVLKKETSASNVLRVMNFLTNHNMVEQTARFFDCSGLGVRFLLDNKLISHRMTADELFRNSYRITKDSVGKGDWCFKLDSSGRATHVGYCVNDKQMIIESKGRDDGVVKRPIDEGGWDAYARPRKYFPELKQLGIGRKLKLHQPYMTGEDVKLLQSVLGVSADGVYGPKTEQAVIEANKRYGISADGCTKKLVQALHIEWTK